MTNRAGFDASKSTTFSEATEPGGVICPKSKVLSKPDQGHYIEGAAPCPHCGGYIQPIDITDMFNLDGFEMNVNKYLLRYKFKGDRIKDLTKMVQYAKWMLEREKR